jgi:outer membrane lipoprotein
MKRTFVLIILVSMMASCAHVISEEVRADALKAVHFKAVRKDIEKYKGSTFIWGGFIVKTKATDEGTEIEIVQNPIDKYGDIPDPDVSYGRFIALHPEELDPLIYERSRFVTVAGELVEERKVLRKNREYVYPVLKVKELHLWREEAILYMQYPVYWDYPYGMKSYRDRPYGIHPYYYYRY